MLADIRQIVVKIAIKKCFIGFDLDARAFVLSN